MSGDETWIGKRLHVVNVTYTIVNECLKAMTDDGNYILAIIKIKVDNESLKTELENLCGQMRKLKQIRVTGNSWLVYVVSMLQIPMLHAFGAATIRKIDGNFLWNGQWWMLTLGLEP